MDGPERVRRFYSWKIIEILIKNINDIFYKKRKESEEVGNCGVSLGNYVYFNFAKEVNMSKERLGMKRSVGARRCTHGFFRRPLFSFCIGVSRALRILK